MYTESFVLKPSIIINTMGLFSQNKNSVRHGVLVDIGSGSVLIAIVTSDQNKSYPDIIWSKREYTPFKPTDEMSVGAKSIMTSIMNVFMALDGEGRASLTEVLGRVDLDYVQVTVTAPWSYTVTKTISYQQDEDFVLSNALVQELLETAQKKVVEELKRNEQIYRFGLTLVSRTVSDIVANGYLTKSVNKQKVKTLKLFQSNTIIQNHVMETLIDSKNKIIPGSDVSMYSFMLCYFHVLKDLYTLATEFCLVDITYEATEIGIVRDGILRYCTHIPYGAFSIAREISAITSIPLEEAYSYLSKSNIDNLFTKHSAMQKNQIQKVFYEYQNRLVDLFNETGDSLSIPKKIFLHGNLRSEPFFKKHVNEAADTATSSSHAVYTVSEKVLTEHYAKEAQGNIKNSKKDTALLISAQFFHNKAYHLKFEQL